VLQYLSCKDKDVRVHMEDALVALFRASEPERAAIAERRRAEDGSGDYMSMAGISGLLGLGDRHGLGHSSQHGSSSGGLGGSRHGSNKSSSTNGHITGNGR
jgi:hypothetical protein